MIAACLAGAAVFAGLPSGSPPTLRQAITAAQVPASGAPAKNLDKEITGWSWGCSGDNYTVGYYLVGEDPAHAQRMWIDRYDAQKKTWAEASYEPKSRALSVSGALEPPTVITVFEDGFDVYAQLQTPTGDAATLQFTRDLAYLRQFAGSTLAGLNDGVLLYAPDQDSDNESDAVVDVFEPNSGASRTIFPPQTKPPIEIQGEALAAQLYAACGSGWFQRRAILVNAKHPFRGVFLPRTNLANDALAFAIDYGGGEKCPEAGDRQIVALYVFLHPGDARKMRYVEIPLKEGERVTAASLDALLTSDSLGKLFAAGH